MKSFCVSVFALLCIGAPVRAQERPLAFTGATIIPISGPAMTDGVLVVHRGKIVAVGPKGSTRVPADAETVSVAGRVIMPGLIDSHSHIGSGSGADGSAPIQPDVRLLDGINVRHPSIQRAQAGGITTVNVMPGSGHLLSGQTLYLKVRDGRTVDDLLIRDAGGRYLYGIKMANGTNPLRSGAAAGPFSGTRAKSAALVREQFVRAEEYREKVRRAGNDKTKQPPRDLGLEQLVDVLDRKLIVHFHTHRHDDIMTILRLQKEFGFRVVLHHVSEGYKVADEIARAGVGSSIIVLDSPGGKLETMDFSSTNGAVLERVGALFGFHTDDYITDSRLFLRSAGMAVRYGMSRERALYAMTMGNARLLDLQDRVGSLEAGKDADFIILSGDPLSVYTHVLETYVEGVRVFNRADPQDKLYATGGYGAGRDEAVHFGCYEGEDY
ncbi:MAG TPA: amidohydrolase family protein [Pyrinomonadaceae bacterium]|nr:amidohydrolase family protein [Pyrinomonadaceae bacterium]